MSKMTAYLAWITLLAALAMWAGVIYAGSWLQSEAQKRGSTIKNAGQKAEEAASASRVRTLVHETAADRERLESAARVDIVDIANDIEAVGRSVGVEARVSTALPSGKRVDLPGGVPLSDISFIILAEGSFAGVAQFVKVLEDFPGFATIEQFDLESISSPTGVAREWRTGIRLNIRTTSDVSS